MRVNESQHDFGRQTPSHDPDKNGAERFEGGRQMSDKKQAKQEKYMRQRIEREMRDRGIDAGGVGEVEVIHKPACCRDASCRCEIVFLRPVSGTTGFARF